MYQVHVQCRRYIHVKILSRSRPAPFSSRRRSRAVEMLFANKQALETDLKVELLSIRERELALYTENCQNIASISCMLAGFAYVTLTYENEDTFADQSHYLGRPVYELLAMFGMLCNMASMFGSTVCTMLGPGLALRGGDGAVDQAVEGLALEYRTIFMLFLMGVVSFYACFTIFLVLDYNQGSTLDVCLHGVIILCFLVFLRSTARACKRIYKKFRLPPEHAVAGSFDPDGTQHVASREATELTTISPESLVPVALPPIPARHRVHERVVGSRTRSSWSVTRRARAAVVTASPRCGDERPTTTRCTKSSSI